jgi:hypothetical protein
MAADRGMAEACTLDFRFGEFEIDLGQHELRRSGRAIRIEPQVFDLLVDLIQNRTRIVIKDELIAVSARRFVYVKAQGQSQPLSGVVGRCSRTAPRPCRRCTGAGTSPMNPFRGLRNKGWSNFRCCHL